MALRVFATNSIGTGVRADLGTTDDVIVAEGAIVASTDTSAIVGTGSLHSIRIDGSLYSELRAIDVGAPDTFSNRVVIGVTGDVQATAGVGILVASRNSVVENHGTILGGAGVAMNTQDDFGTSRIINTGIIEAQSSVALSHGGHDGILVNNSGLIKSPSVAFVSGTVAGTATIVNTGTMIGGIQFGFGDDIYDGRHGRLLDPIAGTDIVTGGSGNDRLLGGIDGDFFIGDFGADLLDGGKGSDKLDGGDNDDTLIGGLGLDTLTGGAGKDSFVFNVAVIPANRDTITDFNRVADTIRLENAVFTKVGAAGVLKAAAFKLSTQTKDADDRIIYNKATG